MCLIVFLCFIIKCIDWIILYIYIKFLVCSLLLKNVNGLLCLNELNIFEIIFEYCDLGFCFGLNILKNLIIVVGMLYNE